MKNNQSIIAEKKATFDLLRELLRKVNMGDVNQKDEIGFTVLIHASKDGFTEQVKELVMQPGIRINALDDDGWTALTWACCEGHTEVARILLAHPDVRVNLQDKLHKDSALMWACYHGHTEIVNLLLKHPDIDINLQRNYGSTALTLAAGEGHTEIVQILLARPEINVNLQEKDGDTPLMAAAGRGHASIVQMLLACPNIDVDAQDWEGKTALTLAANNACKDLLTASVFAGLLNRLSSAPIHAVNKPILTNTLTPNFPTTTINSTPTNTANITTTSAKSNNTINSTKTNISNTSTLHSTEHISSLLSKQPRSWLAARLLQSGYDATTITQCEQKLVVQEGFVLESDFAACLPSEFNRDYLVSIGITGLGMQKRLLTLHSELHSQVAHRPAMPVSGLALENVSPSTPFLLNTTRSTTTITTTAPSEDDSSLDPVYVPIEPQADRITRNPAYVSPTLKRCKILNDMECVNECKQL